jgi:hypothetical protein
MTEAPPARGTPGRNAALAIAAGVGVSAAVALAGQAVALVLFLLRGAHGSYGPYLRLGALYVELFHHVDVELRLGSAAGRSLSVALGAALLLVTAAAAVALAALGARLARRATGPRAAGLVLALAGGYALVPLVAAFLARGSVVVPLPVGVTLREIDVPAPSAFALAFATAAAAAAIGAISAGAAADSPGDVAVADAVLGGVRAFALGLVLSVAGVLVLGSLRPSFVRAYASVMTAPDSLRGRAVVVGHAVLLLPNQAMWVLVPAMGACDEAVVDGRATPFLCYWRSPAGVPAADAGAFGRSPFRAPSRAYLAFVLVPLLASVGGGLRAARRAATIRARLLTGAGSGLVFAALAAAAIALSRIEFLARGAFLGTSTVRLSVGPELIRGSLLAVAWGIGGGAVGGLASRYVGGTGTTSSE